MKHSQGKLVEAILEYDRANELSPDDASLYMVIELNPDGWPYNEQGRLKYDISQNRIGEQLWARM